MSDYNTLIADIAQITHRTDLGPRMQSIVNQANEMLEVRLSKTLEAPSPTNLTNELLTQQYNLYLYAALMPAYEFINELDMVDHYQKRWLEEVDYYYITSLDSADSTPVMVGT
jgi:hypothetical protein